MSIEVRGAKHAYMVFIHAMATRHVGDTIKIRHHYGSIMVAADSEDEAYGRGARIAARSYPSANGFEVNYIRPVQIDIDGVLVPPDIDSFEPVPGPWEEES